MWSELKKIKEQYRPELKYLLELLKHRMIDGSSPPCIPSSDTFNWELFLILVRHHRLVPSIYPILSRNPEGIPPTALSRLDNLYKENQLKMLPLAGQLVQITREFKKSGIESVALKGPAMAQQLYGDPTMRTSNDLDILVKEKDVVTADGILRRDGFKRISPNTSLSAKRIKTCLRVSKHFGYICNQRRMNLELHWRPTEHDKVFSLSTQRFFSESGLEIIAGEALRRVDKECLLTYLCVHGSSHLWFRLAWLFDVAMVAKSMSIDALETLAKDMSQRKAHRPLVETLALLYVFFDWPLSTSIETIAKHDAAIKSMAKIVVNFLDDINSAFFSQKDIPYPMRKLHSARMRPANLAIQQKLASALAPHPIDIERYDLPDNLFFLYVLLRPFSWVNRVLKKEI